MAEKPDTKEKYDAADNSARCYAEALAALRAKLKRGEPVTLFGRRVEDDKHD